MGKEYRAKVFKSGNSLALRLPKQAGFKEGATLTLREGEDGFFIVDEQRPKRKFNVDKVWGCAVGTGLHFLEPDDRVFEERSLIWDDFQWRSGNMPDS